MVQQHLNYDLLGLSFYLQTQIPTSTPGNIVMCTTSDASYIPSDYTSMCAMDGAKTSSAFESLRFDVHPQSLNQIYKKQSTSKPGDQTAVKGILVVGLSNIPTGTTVGKLSVSYVVSIQGPRIKTMSASSTLMRFHASTETGNAVVVPTTTEGPYRLYTSLDEGGLALAVRQPTYLLIMCSDDIDPTFDLPVLEDLTGLGHLASVSLLGKRLILVYFPLPESRSRWRITVSERVRNTHVLVLMGCVQPGTSLIPPSDAFVPLLTEAPFAMPDLLASTARLASTTTTTSAPRLGARGL